MADNLYEVGLTGQGLRKLEEKLELMEKHWEEFCMEVPLLNNLLDLKLLWFSSCQRCTTDVSWPLLKQEREKGQLYREKSLEAACAISQNYQKMMVESGRQGAEDLAAMMELIKILGS